MAVNHSSKEQGVDWDYVHLNAPKGPMAYDIEVWTKRHDAERTLIAYKLSEPKFTFEVVEIGQMVANS